MSLETVCLACARHTAGDDIGKLLAIVCLAPYLVLLYTGCAVHLKR
jgi:hypothetical protein